MNSETTPERGSPMQTAWNRRAGTVATQGATYADVDWANLNWDVVLAGMQRPDNPNHEEGLPSMLEARARYGEYGQLVDNNGDVDVNAELDALQADLQAIFDAAG